MLRTSANCNFKFKFVATWVITEQTELFTLADRTSLLIGVTAVRQDDLTAHKLARYLGILNETPIVPCFRFTFVLPQVYKRVVCEKRNEIDLRFFSRPYNRRARNAIDLAKKQRVIAN